MHYISGCIRFDDCYPFCYEQSVSTQSEADDLGKFNLFL